MGEYECETFRQGEALTKQLRSLFSRLKGQLDIIRAGLVILHGSTSSTYKETACTQLGIQHCQDVSKREIYSGRTFLASQGKSFSFVRLLTVTCGAHDQALAGLARPLYCVLCTV